MVAKKRTTTRLEELQTFVGVVESGGFTAAAERLGLAKSAVSRRVSDLESRLGVQLLHRTTRRVSLTEAGEQLYERALRILADLEEAETAVASAHASLRGRVRMAAPLSFGLLHLAPALTGFLARHPAVTLDLDLNDREVGLVEEGFDLSLRIGRLADSSLVARRLAPVRLVACASPGYLERHGEPREPADLSRHQGLAYAHTPPAQQWSFRAPNGQTVSVTVPTRLRANNGDVLLRAAEEGLGVAVLPTFIAWRALAEGTVRPVLAGFPPPEESAYAVYPSRRHLPQRVRVLIEFLAERFGEAPYWDGGRAPAVG
jgi:DNA-binding transcriptional LysR family regulator